MNRLLASLVLLFAAPLTADTSQSLKIDPAAITVSGISAGGQMAHQLHIAYPDLFSGAGIIAGGPFGCADGSLATAMGRCMGKVDGEFPVDELTASIRTAAIDGRISDPAQLRDDPVWLFHGSQDLVVATEVSDALNTLYAEFIPAENITYVTDVAVGHTYPARGAGHACETPQAPFVGDCDYDAAGLILQHMYPGLNAPERPAETELMTVELPGASAAGLSETAYLFVPPACASAERSCSAHLVLHGCAQSAVQLGTDFMLQSGYLPWAEANNIVLAFPQVVPGATNPFACWDWWGYTGADYRWRNGAQMLVLVEWIRGLSVTH